MQRSKAEAPNANCSIFTKMHQSCGEYDEDRPDTADTFNQINHIFRDKCFAARMGVLFLEAS